MQRLPVYNVCVRDFLLNISSQTLFETDQPSSQLPKYGDYALVPAVPSPSPSELGPTAVKELMTWGTLLGTPRAIGGDDDIDLTPNNFKMNEPGRRDDIGRRLATNASRSMRERAQGYGITPKGLAVLSAGNTSGSRANGQRAGSMGPPAPPTPGSSTPRRRAEALTPAAKSLLQRSVMGTPQRSGVSGLGLPRSAGTRSRGEAMEKNGGWRSADANKPANRRTWCVKTINSRREPQLKVLFTGHRVPPRGDHDQNRVSSLDHYRCI